MKSRSRVVLLWLMLLALLLAGALLTRSAEAVPVPGAVVTSGHVAGLVAVAAVLLAAALIRLLVLPKFTRVPGHFQALLELPVAFFTGRARRRRERRARAQAEAAKAQRELSAQLLLERSGEQREGQTEQPEQRARRAGVGAALKGHMRFLLLWLPVLAVLLIGGLVSMTGGHHESVQEAMRDAVLHEENRIAFFGTSVNPGLISAFTVTGVLLLAAALLRVFVIPRFRTVPGRLQLLLEMAVGYFDGLAKTNSPHRNKFLGCYVFSAGVYIFVGTIFELFGVQAVTTNGHSVALPAPLSDVNAALCLGCLSYLVIVFGGLMGSGLAGLGAALKDFSLPISMSFRLFGALLSGLLVTELVYYYVNLSIVLPVVVGVLFTLLHALIQTYVLTMLTAMYYGEVSHPKDGH